MTLIEIFKLLWKKFGEVAWGVSKIEIELNRTWLIIMGLKEDYSVDFIKELDEEIGDIIRKNSEPFYLHDLSFGPTFMLSLYENVLEETVKEKESPTCEVHGSEETRDSIGMSKEI